MARLRASAKYRASRVPSTPCAFVIFHLGEAEAQTVAVKPDKASAEQWAQDHADEFPHQLIIIKLHY